MTDIRPASNAAQLQDDIDSGRTGDKVAGLDPASAPLGTDEEAAGTPLDPHVVAEARAAERAPAGKHRHPNAAEPTKQPDALGARPSPWPPMLIGGGLAIATLGILALVLI